MSWTHPLVPGHVGELLGLVERADGESRRYGDPYRELHPETDGLLTRSPWYGCNLIVLQLGCTCGWRSDRIVDKVPTVALWTGHVEVRAEFLEQCRKQWLAHATGTVYRDQAANAWTDG